MEIKKAKEVPKWRKIVGYVFGVIFFLSMLGVVVWKGLEELWFVLVAMVTDVFNIIAKVMEDCKHKQAEKMKKIVYGFCMFTLFCIWLSFID